MMQLKTLSPVEIMDDNLELFQMLYQEMLDYNSSYQFNIDYGRSRCYHQTFY